MDIDPFTAQHRGGSGPPLVCLHGFTDTWRTWDLVLPALQERHEVLAVTLAGHAGGPPIDGAVDDDVLVDAVEQAMNDAGLDTAHIVGNSLGGYVALRLAARGRARTVVALAPAGGWAADDESFRETLRYFAMMDRLVKDAAPHADEIAATREGRRRATQAITTNYEHIPAELVAHMIRGAASCTSAAALIEHAMEHGWPLRAQDIACPVRMIWGTEDQLLRWPSAAERFRTEWLPHADWVTLDGIGHCPQLDTPLETAQLILGFAAE
ncbi:MAG: alpha/beta hydrolase [Solirubrobacteraceae bacterium]